MTDRLSWVLGASSCILGGSDNHNKDGFSKYARAGIKYCELTLWPSGMEKHDFFNNPQKLNKMINNCGVSVYSVHLPFTEGVTLSSPDKEETRKSIEMMKKVTELSAQIGAKVVVVHPSAGHYDEWESREDLLRHSIACVKEVSEYADSFGLKCAVENMIPRGIGNTADEIMLYLNEAPTLGLCFDLNHSLIQTNREFFDKLIETGMQKRIYHIHVSDYDFKDERHLLPMEGVNDWEMILDKLEQLDYTGAFMYEVPSENATLDEIAQNYNHLMKRQGLII